MSKGKVLSRIFIVVVCTLLFQVRASATDNEKIAAKPYPADTVINNALIFTSAKHDANASALAVRDGLIVYVGTEKKAKSFVGTHTQVIDAKNSLITPGFIDAHTHAVWLGMLSPVMTLVYDAKNLDEMKSLVRNFAEQKPELPFVLAIGWKYDYIPGGIPTLAMADEILADRALILWSHDGHTGWVNSMALKRMQEKNPKAFAYLTPDYGSDQKPTGIFRHFYTINPMDFYSIEEMGGESILEKMAVGLKAKLDEGLAVGVTSHHDVMIHRSTFELLKEMDRKNAFRDARVRASYFINHHLFEDDPAALLESLKDWRRFAGNSTDHFVVGESVKLGIDGVGPNHTAFLDEPYTDDPDSFGVASYTAEDFKWLATQIDAMHMQMCTHGVGDAGITRIIDGYAKARKANGHWDARHTIEHNSMVVDRDVRRMRELGIYASMQPTHYFGDKSIVQTLGEERFRHMHRIGTLQRAKVNLAFGTDFSIVPMNPVYGLIAATTRLNCLGWPVTEAEKKEIIRIDDAIRHYTIGSARALKMDDRIGSLEVGKRADFVLFSLGSVWPILETGFGNVDIELLDSLVLATFVDGRIVYQRQ